MLHFGARQKAGKECGDLGQIPHFIHSKGEPGGIHTIVRRGHRSKRGKAATGLTPLALLREGGGAPMPRAPKIWSIFEGHSLPPF